jgi:hypothetical protein
MRLGPKRIEQFDAGAFDIGDVAGDQDQAEDPSRRGQEALDDWQWIWDVDPSPLLGNRAVDGQDSVAMGLAQEGEPTTPI